MCTFGQPAHDEQIEMVERRGEDAHAHLACPTTSEGTGRSSRSSIRSSPPWAEMVSPRTPMAGGYIGRRNAMRGWSGAKGARRLFDFAPRRALMTAIKVPPLGESIVEATVSRWLKQEGDAVAAGDTLVELETDKITVEVPALAAGVLAKRARNEGDVVKVDELLGELTEGARRGAAARRPSAAAPGRSRLRRRRRRAARTAAAAAARTAPAPARGACVARGAARGGGAERRPCRRRRARDAAVW